MDNILQFVTNLTSVSSRCCGYVQILLLRYYKHAKFLKIFFSCFSKKFITWSRKPVKEESVTKENRKVWKEYKDNEKRCLKANPQIPSYELQLKEETQRKEHVKLKRLRRYQCLNTDWQKNITWFLLQFPEDCQFHTWSATI